MKLIDGRITFLVGQEETTIELHDMQASVTFAKIHLTPEELSSALSRLGYTRCSIEVYNLDRLNKKMRHRRLVVEMPSNKPIDKKMARMLIAKKCPDGWEPDYYLNSQDTFFTKDRKNYVQCTIRRWGARSKL